jgi:hypothetical protein
MTDFGDGARCEEFVRLLFDDHPLSVVLSSGTSANDERERREKGRTSRPSSPYGLSSTWFPRQLCGMGAQYTDEGQDGWERTLMGKTEAERGVSETKWGDEDSREGMGSLPCSSLTRGSSLTPKMRLNMLKE